jgi:hypothetical protein
LAYDVILTDLCKVQLLARPIIPAGVTTPELTERETRLKSTEPQMQETLQQARTKYEKQLQGLLDLETKLKAIFDKFRHNLHEYCQIVANDGKPLGYVGLGMNKLSSYNIPLPGKEEGKDQKESGQPKGEKAKERDGAGAAPQKPLAADKQPAPPGILDSLLSVFGTPEAPKQ